MNRLTRESRRSPDEIRHDIDRTRGEIDGTMEAIEHRFTPGNLLDELWNRFTRGGAGGVADAVREHPVPLALMGLGIGWLAVEQASSRKVGAGTYARAPGRRGPYGPEAVARGEHEDSSGGVSGRAREMAHDAREKLRGAGDKLSDAVSGSGEEGESMMEHASETVHRARDQAREQTRRAGRGMKHMLEENPVALGAIAFGVGLASGVSVPSTHAEDRLAGPASDRVKHEAEKVGHEVEESARHVAGEAAAAAEEEVERRADEVEGGADEAERGMD